MSKSILYSTAVVKMCTYCTSIHSYGKSQASLPNLSQTSVRSIRCPGFWLIIPSNILVRSCLMEDLPDQLVWVIFDSIEKTVDRNSVSLACKRFHKLDNEQRKSLRVGCGLNPATEALTSLCHRFPNLKKVEIFYSGWMSKLGKQLDDQGLSVLSASCPFLCDLILSYCSFVSDAGLSCIASCSKLSALKLNFTPRITGCGILTLVMGCRSLKVLHLIRCLNVSSVEWLEYLGKLEKLEDLCIKNCRAIGEGDLNKLGPTWKKIKHLQFEVDTNHRYRNVKIYDQLAIDRWQKQLPCENMLELCLVNCIINPGRGLACVLGMCKNLEKIQLDMCGARDSDIMCLAQNSRNLRSISFRVSLDFSHHLLLNNPLRLTDASLKALAQNCPKLETVRLSFANGEFPSLSSFSLDGIATLMKMCPIRKLSLDSVYSFTDVGMEELCSSQYLQSLELVRCQEISDEGLVLVGQYPKLRELRLSKCLGITDEGLKPLVRSGKLELLVVDDCPQVSEKGVHGTAKSVNFKQDLSWMC